MRKLISVILAIVISLSVLCLISACNKETKENLTTTRSSLATELNQQIINNENDVGGGDLSLTKYRRIYCNIPRPFSNLVDLFEFQDWYEDVIKNDPNKTEIMPMKLFIQEFNISREDFDRANLEWAKIIIKGFKGKPMMDPQDFANQETDEVYNADIIYTFDDEIINDYYLSHEYPYLYELEFEQAVADGTYQTRTTDWVDVEQMEAEIIAKYGEVEISNETTIPPYEITTTEKSTTETTE
ncbi:MAG: hypothetical protein E7547_07485 [Ruminococcaceae bacterium]|nr:hypothetical protein [Oscillospiraceae bacterium]